MPNTARPILAAAAIVVALALILGAAVALFADAKATLPDDPRVCWVTPSGDAYGPDDPDDLPINARRIPCPDPYATPAEHPPEENLPESLNPRPNVPMDHP